MSTPEEPPVEPVAETTPPPVEAPTTVQPVVRERGGFSRWIRTPLGVGILVGVLVLVLCAVPAGVVGLVLGSHFGGDGRHIMGPHHRIGGPGKGMFNRQREDRQGRLRLPPGQRPGKVPGPVPGQPTQPQQPNTPAPSPSPAA
jgi:hypothetical protein